jgi:TP901 family phage tail tape measure protein
MAATNIQRIVQIVLRVVDETKGVLGKVAKNFKQVESSTKQAGAASAASASDVKKLSKELKDTGTQAKQSAAALDKASAATKKLASTKLSRVLVTVRTKLSRVTSSVSSYAKSVGTAVGKNSLFTKSMVRIKAGASGMQGSLVGMLGAFAGLAATVGGLIFPITKAAKFERAMSEVKAVSGATEAQIAKLSTKASELGRTTEYTGVQSAQAMKMLAMAGLSAEDIFDSVGHVLRVAHAGAVDLGVAADICTNIMTGFRLESSDLARVNDVLVQTFTNTNSTLEELGHAMAYVAPVAAGLGGNFEDLTATVGLLHNAGIKGTMAGTALRGMLFRLFNPTKEEADLMAKLNDRIGDVGLQIRDTSGSFVGFVSLVEQLEGAQVDAAEAMAMFGQRAGPGMAALLGMGSKVLAEYVALNEKAQGRAEEISRVMGQNVVGAFREAKSAVSSLTNAIGKQLLPEVNKLIRGTTEYIVGLVEWIKEHKTFTTGVMKVIGAISALIAIVASLKLVLFAIGPALGVVIKVVSGLVAFFTWGGAAVVSFYAAIAAFVAFLVGITFSETFRKWVGSLEFFGVAVKDWGTYVLAEFTAFWTTMKYGFKLMWLDLKGAVGFDVTAQRAELEESLHRELAARNEIVKAITEGGAAVRLEEELQAALKERAIAIQEAINEVTADYEAQISEARKAWEDVSKQVASLRTELENLIGQAQEKLGALAESFSTIISRSFAETETSAIVDGIKNQIAEVERVYSESDAVRKNKVRELENELSNARIRITASTVKQALAMWDVYGNKQQTLLDASLTAQLMAQGEYNQRVNALQQEVLAAKKNACERATEILKAELNKSLAAEESLAAKIKSIQDDIAGFHKSAEEKIRELRRKGMTDEQAYADRVLELNQKLAEARALDPSQYEEAKRLFNEVKGAASGLVGEIKKGDQVLISEHRTISDAIRLIESAESGMVAAGTAVQSVTKTRLTEQTELTDTLANGLAVITKKYEEINTALGKAITVKVELDTAGVDRDLEKLTISKELYITAKAEFDEATKKLGELELAKVRATEEATLRVEAEFDPKIEDIKAELAALETESITVQATVEGTDDVQALDTAIDDLDDKEVDAGADVYGEPAVHSLKTAIDSLRDKTVTVTTNYVEAKQAGGIANYPDLAVAIGSRLF